MIIYRYYCILCGFIFHCVKPYSGSYKCPSCSVVVEARALSEEEKPNEQQGEGEKSSVN